MKNYRQIFSELNSIPRPSHHEERVADYLCKFAEDHGLKYHRDAQNCVVIEKPASPGCEGADPVVILNHMDMVCVAKDGYLRDGHTFDPLNDEIRPYVEVDQNGRSWMKAEGTSLGADNGMGLSMALAVLADDTLVHPALEVLTTTNEEDGMSGAEGLSLDFIRGRKIINLDSEAYDEITVGAAGACLQVGKWDVCLQSLPTGYACYRIILEGGLGGHSGVDINKDRCNCNKELFTRLAEDLFNESNNPKDILLCCIKGGTANASIASCAEAVVAVPASQNGCIEDYVSLWNKDLQERYAASDANVCVRSESIPNVDTYIADPVRFVKGVANLPYGVMAMREDMPDTVMTSNNIGVVSMSGSVVTVSCHTRSFDNDEQTTLSTLIRNAMVASGAMDVEMLMDTPSWVERPDSPLLALTCQTFKDVLGFEPKKVAMHFVLEAAYYVAKYPGVEMASIGPLIIEPHSTSERVALDSCDNIWRVTVELLRRCAQQN